jgi:hypothetical protein
MNFIKIIRERKIIDGKLYRKYFIGSEGKEVGIPPYVSLVKIRAIFYVRIHLRNKQYPDTFSTCIPYQDAISQENALRRAIAILTTMTKGKQATTAGVRTYSKRTNSIEKLKLDPKEIPDGISVNLEKESGYEKVTVSASYFDPKINKFRAKRFYIGTLNTWRERYPAKLQEAITHREESLKLYTALTQVTK